MSSHDELMKAGKAHQEEFYRALTPHDDSDIADYYTNIIDGWMEFLDNWNLRRAYLKVVPTFEQQTRLDYWDRFLDRMGK